MSKADTLAKLVSTGGPLADGAIAVSDISGLQTTLDGKLALSGGTLTGNLTFNGTQTWPTFNQNTTGNAATATTANNVSGGTANVTSITDSGNLTFTGTGNRITGDFSNATAASRVAFQTSTANGNTTVGLLPNGTGNATTLVAFNGSDPTNANPMQVRTTATEAGLFLGANGTATAIPMTFWNGGSERVRIDASGNMGIGTNNPGTYGKLEVVGSGYTATSLRSSDASGVIVALAANAADGARLNVLSNHPLQFFTNNTERMRIDSAGNVGIGTSSPEGKLRVYTSGAYNGTAISKTALQISTDVITGGFAASRIQWSFGTIGNGVKSWIEGSVYGNDYLGIGYGADEHVRFASSGNVGIGTSSPSQKLHVVGAVASYGATASLDQSCIQISYESGVGTLTSSNGSGGAIAFRTNPASNFTAERMRIDSSGNVGIGTTSPATRLELSKVYVGAGPTWAGGDDLLKLTAASGSAWAEPAIAFHEIGSNIGAKIGVKNTGNGAMNIIFANRDGSSLTSTMTERARISTDGALLVGRTSIQSGLTGSLFVGDDRQIGLDGGSGSVFIRGNVGGWATGMYAVGSSGTFRGGFGFLGGADSLTYYWVGTAYNGTGVLLNSGSTSWSTLSDEREKNIHGVIENALDKIVQFDGIYYNYKSDAEGTRHRVGFSAQKVQAAFPEAVEEVQREVENPSEETKRLTLSTTDIVPLLVQAIKELKAEFDAYKLTHP